MRIERLDLAAFGRFTGQILDFGPGTPDFHLLYGANEAGKSTTLAAIVDLLYGIEERSPFNFLHAYRDMRLKAAVSDGGTLLSFQRRKGRDKTLLDEGGAPIDEARLAGLRGNEDRAFFTGMFGLNHTRLREGGEHLKSSKGDLGQTLFQAGAAVRDLQELLKRLDGEATELFKPGGQNPRINRGLAALKEGHGRIRHNALKGDAWTQLEDDIAQVQRRLEEIAAERSGLIARRSQLERIHRVLPLFARHDRLVEELAGLADAPLLPETASQQRREAENTLTTHGHVATQAETKLTRWREERSGLSVDQAVLGAQDAIDRLREQHGAIAKALEDLPTRYGERRQVDARITAALRDLGRNLDPADARQALLAKPAMAAIRDLIAEEAELSANARQTADAATKAVNLARQREAELARVPPLVDLGPLEECLKEVTRRGRPDDLLAEAEAELASHGQALDTALAALPGWSGDAEALARLPVPADNVVTELDQHLADAARRAEAAGQALDKADDDLAQAESELASLSEAGPVVTEAAVAAARRHRDEGWRLVRRRFVEGLAVDHAAFTAGRPLPDAYEQSVADADSLSDRVGGEAQRAARHEAATERKALAEQRRGKAGTEVAAAAAALAALEAEWKALWRDCALDPARPRAMLGFLSGRRDILGRAEKMDAAGRTVTRLKAQIADGRGKLAAALTAAGGHADGLDFAALVVRVEETITSLGHSNTRRRSMAGFLDDARNNVRPAEARRDAAAKDLDDWRRRWGLALAPLGQAAEAGTAEVVAVLDVLDALATQVAERDGLTHRIEAMEADVGKFNAEVEALAAAVAPDLKGRPALDGLTDLAGRAQAARDADAKLRDIKRQIDETEGEKRAAEHKCREAEETSARLCRQAGCAQPDGLEEAERRSARRHAAEADKADLERDLLQAGSGLGLEALAAEATSIDRDRIDAEKDSVGKAIADLEAEAEGIKTDLTQYRQAQQAMNGDSVAAAAAEEVEQISAGLKDDAARYIRLRLGNALLRQAMERFRTRHQGPLMERAAELFRRLTLDAFAGLDTGYDERDEPMLLAVRTGGDKLEVAGLSEGTRDQLFLALRLAAVELHLAAGRRLPFIADDLLIHFDDDRAAAALAVLADLATRTQVLFFTHNRHLVDLAKARLPVGAYRVAEV